MSNRPVVIAVPEDGHVLPALRQALVDRPGQTSFRLVRAGAAPSDPARDEALHRAEQQVRAVVGPDADIATCSLAGRVVDSVVAAAEDAQALLVQRRDRQGSDQLLGRSTSAALAAHAHVPVLVVPESFVEARHGRVAVGLDDPDRSEVLLEHAFTVAAARGASLRVVHLVWAVGGLGEYLVEQSTAQRHLAEACTVVEAALASVRGAWPQVAVEVDVRRADPVPALLLEAAHADLLVVERRDPVLPASAHLGPVADALVREADCPVLVVTPTRRHRRSGSDRSAEQGAPRA